MNNITIILADDKPTNIPEICFNATKGNLSLNGQSLYERLCLEFLPFSKKIIIVTNNNVYKNILNKLPNIEIIPNSNNIHNNVLYNKLLEIKNIIDSVTIVDSSIVIAQVAIDQYFSDCSINKCILSSTLYSHNDNVLIFNKKTNQYSIDRAINIDYNKHTEICGKYWGIATLPLSEFLYTIEKHPFTYNLYIDAISNCINDTYKFVYLNSNNIDKILSADDYFNTLNNTNFDKIHNPFSELNALSLSKCLQKYVGIYDILGGKIAQYFGFDGIWLGSYQICTALGIEDDENYNPIIALNLAKQLKKQLVELPIIVDIGSGFLNDDDLIYFSQECIQTYIVAVCVDDNKNRRINSMFSSPKRELLSDEEFCERIHKIKSVLPFNIKIIARTELLTMYGEEVDYIRLNNRINSLDQRDVDIILPHYVGNNFQFIQNVIKNIYRDIPIILIPTGLLNIPQKSFAEMGIRLIIYANLDMRNRIKSLMNIYEAITTAKCVDSKQQKSLASPTEIKQLLDIIQRGEN